VPDPSTFLIAALTKAGKHAVVPPPSPLPVPSIPRTLKDQKKRFRQGHPSSRPSVASVGKSIHPKLLSLQWITAKFIRWEHLRREQLGSSSREKVVNRPAEDLDSFGTTFISHGADTQKSTVPLGPFLSVDELAFLSERNFTTQDVKFWAILLAESDTVRVADALLTRRITVDDQTVHSHNRVPLFVLAFVLRRTQITAPALRSLVNYSWQTLFGRLQTSLQDCTKNSKFRIPVTDDQAVFVLFVRLTRHARKVWPAALPNISAWLATHALHSGHLHLLQDRPELDETQLARLSGLCNRALRLLSLPTNLHPLKSALHQQRAQFDLIRCMAQHKPPLPVTRMGHQSLTDVLLRLKKTPQERDWAELKAKSWPPFKQSKTRLDDEKDPEYGISRAGQSIRFLQEYGYPLQEKDVIASIMSGWHPDGSPTIQMRAITEQFRKEAKSVELSTAKQSSLVVSALITSTRTLEEAWACFLMYKQSPLPPTPSVYLAMFKKIIHDDERSRFVVYNSPEQDGGKTKSFDNLKPLPGDGLETVKSSQDPAEAVYISTPVPSLEELFDRMLGDGLRPDKYLLQLLVSRAFTLESGIRFWNSQWEPVSNQVNDISGIPNTSESRPKPALNPRDESSTMQPEKFPPLTDHALTNLIELLCRFPDYPLRGLPRLTRRTLVIANWQFRDMHPMVYALLLLMHYKPTYRPTWNAVLRSLTSRAMIMKATRWTMHDRRHLPRLLAMILTQEIVRMMDEADVNIDAQGFTYVCISAQNAAHAGVGLRENIDIPSDDMQDDKERQKMLNLQNRATQEAGFQLWDCPRRLRAMFAKLVGMGKHSTPSQSHIPESTPLPRFLAVPSPSEIHHYVRALGFYGDHEGLLSLIKWMVEAKDGIASNVEGELNGKRKFRTLLVSLRVFLECPGLEHWASSRGVKMTPASDDLVALARNEIDTVREWGGWATDEEVDDYCRE
jgi:hypothetical protein